MKKLSFVFALVALGFGPQAMARDVLVGTDILATIDGSPNLFYQGRVLSNSAYRFSGSSSAGGLTTELGFRFYLDRYANGAYIEGDARLASNGNFETGGRLGIDIKLGNIIVDPYISTASRSYGLSLGFLL